MGCRERGAGKLLWRPSVHTLASCSPGNTGAPWPRLPSFQDGQNSRFAGRRMVPWFPWFSWFSVRQARHTLTESNSALAPAVRSAQPTPHLPLPLVHSRGAHESRPLLTRGTRASLWPSGTQGGRAGPAPSALSARVHSPATPAPAAPSLPPARPHFRTFTPALLLPLSERREKTQSDK